MQLIIFDFDGVVADSERLANQILAEGLSRIGVATTTEEAVRLYMGRRWADCVQMMEQQRGSPLPAGFLAARIAEIHARLIAEVRPVPGIGAFLRRFAHAPRCIASSSKLDYIGQSLDRMALADWFEHRFSGHDVERGKPHPDLFLKAAMTLGAEPSNCVVIEDSPVGVMAGKAAGMLTIGLCAAGHIFPGHAERLAEAGAEMVVATYADLSLLLEPMFATT
jgi:HAD superfamily hydrolase (TIGR01509 family)